MTRSSLNPAVSGAMQVSGFKKGNGRALENLVIAGTATDL